MSIKDVILAIHPKTIRSLIAKLTSFGSVSQRVDFYLNFELGANDQRAVFTELNRSIRRNILESKHVIPIYSDQGNFTAVAGLWEFGHPGGSPEIPYYTGVAKVKKAFLKGSDFTLDFKMDSGRAIAVIRLLENSI